MTGATIPDPPGMANSIDADEFDDPVEEVLSVLVGSMMLCR